MSERLARLEERQAAVRDALTLQAAEYERRLQTLNHENERIASVLNGSVSQERFEQYVSNESEKRELALERVNEKFDDYVRRADQRQREMDLLIQAQDQAAREAKEAVGRAVANAEQAVAQAAQNAKDAAARAEARANRRIYIAFSVLALLVAAVNLVPGL